MKKEFNFYLSLLITVIVITWILFLIGITPNTLDIKSIDALFYNSLYFVAEGNEKLMYLVGLLLGPIVFLITYHLIRILEINPNKKIKKIFSNLFITLIIAFFIYYLFFTDNKYIFHIKILFINTSKYIYILFFIFLLCYILSKKTIKNNKVFNISLIIISILYLLLISLIYLKTNFFFYYFGGAHHFEAFYYPAYYVYHNMDIGINFTNLYGLYPYYLLPIFKLLGGITILKFTTIYTILLFFISILLLIFLYKYLDNYYISFISFFTILMYYLHQLIVFKEDYYYQYIPHRIIFPIIIFFIVYKILTTTDKKQKRFKVLGYIISGMSLLYNIDSGVVTVITYIGFNLYQYALDYDFKNKKLYLESLKTIGFTILSCLFFIGILNLTIYFRTGSNLHLASILYGQNIFYKLGFYMIKMKLVHPWIILIFVYLYVLTYSITKLKCFNKNIIQDDRIKYSLLFTLSLIGLGIFSYYQGRSHMNVFFQVIWPIIIIMAIILDKMNVKKYYKYNYYLREILIVAIFTFYSSILLYNLLYNKNIVALYNPNPYIQKELYNIDSIEKNYHSLKEKYKKVNLILDYTSQYYSYLNITEYPKLDNPVDWLYNREKIDTTVNYILTHPNESFIISKINYNHLLNNTNFLKGIETNFNITKDDIVILTPLNF